MYETSLGLIPHKQLPPGALSIDNDDLSIRDPLIQIFAEARTALSEIALVCREWKEIADDQRLYKEILPSIVITPEDWAEYIGVDAGEAPRLPRCVHRDLANSQRCQLITWAPESVSRKIVNEDGSIQTEIIPLDSAAAVEKIVAQPRKGNPTGFHVNSWKTAIEEKRGRTRSRWIRLNGDIPGSNLLYTQQKTLVRSHRKGADVSNLIDTMISLFMRKVKFGEICFSNLFVRLKDKTYASWSNDGEGELLRLFVDIQESRFLVDYDLGYPWPTSVVIATHQFFAVENKG